MFNTLNRIALAILGVMVFATGSAHAENAPVCDDAVHYPEYHRLDFLIGNWTAYADKTKIADVSIERPAGACALVQTWNALPSEMTFNRPAVAKALVAYDQERRLWELFWVTGVIGVHFHFTATPAENLVWEANETLSTGGTKTDRLMITKLPDGTLREIGTASTDGGKTWVTEYDLIWRKK